MFGEDYWLFFAGRFLAGICVGGEFTAIFTAIDEFLPPKVRGRVDIGIDGTWHLGGVLAALLNLSFGDFEQWRLLFGVGLIGILALICLRRSIPESPRWLIMRGRKEDATKIVEDIEEAVANKRLFLVDGTGLEARNFEEDGQNGEEGKNQQQNIANPVGN